MQGGERSRLNRSIWNTIDVLSSTCLIVGAVCHFTRNREGVQTVGALGVALKWMGFVDFLRAFEARLKWLSWSWSIGKLSFIEKHV